MEKMNREGFLEKFASKNFYVTGGIKSGKTAMSKLDCQKHRLRCKNVLYCTSGSDFDVSIISVDRVVFDVKDPVSIIPELLYCSYKGISFSVYFTPLNTDIARFDSFIKEVIKVPISFDARYKIGASFDPSDCYEELN